MARHRAKRDGLAFNLTLEDIIIPRLCPVMKKPFQYGKGRAHALSPSLDRVVNTRGYTKGNVRVISQRANTIKRDATLAELAGVLSYLRGHARRKTSGV